MWPRLILYRHNSNDFVRNPGVTVSIEYQGLNRESNIPAVLETVRSGRTSIIIEGEDDAVQPYLNAVREIMREGVKS